MLGGIVKSIFLLERKMGQAVQRGQACIIERQAKGERIEKVVSGQRSAVNKR